MITIFWHLIWLMDAQVKRLKGTPPAWFTVGTIFIDLFSVYCAIFGTDF